MVMEFIFESFMGSGVVGFNLAPRKAIFSDTNPYLIKFCKDLQEGVITSDIVREYLEIEGEKLSETPENKQSYYYKVRERFNREHSSLDFLFLQRLNFNGVMRFNSKGEYNVPFGRKPDRFKKALITKIVNQVNWLENLMVGKEWKFCCMPFTQAFEMMNVGDFVYLDPPYIGRYDGYFDLWDECLADQLVEVTQKSSADYALSMWNANKYRTNPYIEKWTEGKIYTTEHFYHVGAKETNRNAMIEALIVRELN